MKMNKGCVNLSSLAMNDGDIMWDDMSRVEIRDTVRNDKAKKERGSILVQMKWDDAQAIRSIVEHSGPLQMPKRRRDPSLYCFERY